MAHPLPALSTLARFRRDARQLLKTYRENPSLCEERIARQCPDDLGPDFKLADAQRVVAREHHQVALAAQQFRPEARVMRAHHGEREVEPPAVELRVDEGIEPDHFKIELEGVPVL